MTQFKTEEHIVAAMQTWADAFSAENLDDIVSLYADDASLWGTLSSVRRDRPDLIREYFEKLFNFSERKVVFDEPVVRLYGDVAVSNGVYLLSWLDDDRKVEVPARYSLIYKRQAENWLIVEHHSSMMPQE